MAFDKPLSFNPSSLAQGLSARQCIDRSERRYDFPVPVVVVGFSEKGVLFHEATFSRNLSPHGFGLHLQTRPVRSESIAVGLFARGERPPAQEHVLCEVVWIREEAGGWDLGARALFDVNILDLAFRDSGGKVTPSLRRPR